ncbi:hypothetical protein H6G33_10350 [Calothrix sp. FACHB-1219]|uniref:hypothetical protein n=1 Tax=unclassified Calothrix TaxID=2619626 RepID=UPI001686639B|nr:MULTISPECIES: hypothetical protein [unclassified Calothrix]MBD2201747.1 hypothetical protein [Calothrix sp. FACHB-168]MBD2217433.1 hypothetical protein [Calothrix sp. FACHB-1219]
MFNVLRAIGSFIIQSKRPKDNTYTDITESQNLDNILDSLGKMNENTRLVSKTTYLNRGEVLSEELIEVPEEVISMWYEERKTNRMPEIVEEAEEIGWADDLKKYKYGEDLSTDIEIGYGDWFNAEGEEISEEVLRELGYGDDDY